MPIGGKTMKFFAKSEFFDYKVFGALGPWGPGVKVQGKGTRYKENNIISLENFFARVAFLRIFSTNY